MEQYDFLRIPLEKRRAENFFRQLCIRQDLIDFCSNDYLGFAQSPELHSRIYNFLKRYEKNCIGSTGSRLISGNSSFFNELETYIAKFHNAEAGLIFNSGYDANIGLLSSVPQRGDAILYDELIHASIRDGIRLSFAKALSFKHNNLTNLENLLKKFNGNTSHPNGKVFIAVESVYSMDGDFAPLQTLVELCNKYNAYLIVDEAHATGVFGKNGEGRAIELGLEKQIFARIHTFGKALGCHGAIVLSSDLLRNYLINFARSFIYTTALPLHSLVAIKFAYIFLQEETHRIEILHNLVRIFKEEIKSLNFNIIDSDSPIQSIIIPGNRKVKEIANGIQKEGYNVQAILSPTVPRGKERIRLCLHYFNTKEEIKGLVKILKKFFN